MKLDNSKFKRQCEIIDSWWHVQANGVFEAVTGFGKTFVVLTIIKRMTDKFPDYRTTVIVPSAQLKLDWEKQILKMNLPNVTVYVVNTYVNFKQGDKRLECELLAADEVHHYISEDAQFFNKVLPITKRRYFIGASATLEEEELKFLSSCGIPKFNTVTVEEAETNGWVAPSLVYNLGLKMTDSDYTLSKDLDRKFRSSFSQFEHNFKLMMACAAGKKPQTVEIRGTKYTMTGQEWRNWWAGIQGYDVVTDTEEHMWHPKRIITYALTGTRSMRERKDFLYNVPSKMGVVLELLERFKDKKVVVFCESQAAADLLQQLCPERVMAYHSNLPTITKVVNGKPKKFAARTQRLQIIKDFEDDNHPCNVIACVKALDEGFNVESIEVAILHSYSSKKRRDVQRRGRASRIDYDNLDKISIIINLYMLESHELKWLKAKQKGTKNAQWISSIDEIMLESNSLSLI